MPPLEVPPSFPPPQLQGTGVWVSVGYPPDTDTPGYATENQSKPAICKAVNAALGSELYSADKVRASFFLLVLLLLRRRRQRR